MFLECCLERYQSDPHENCYHGTELPRGRQGQDAWCAEQSKNDRDKTWENFWMKQGMPPTLVALWQQYNWSWEVAESTEELRRCFDKRGFLPGDSALMEESFKC